MLRVVRLCLAALGVAAMFAGQAQAQTGTVAGRVVDAVTREALSDVVVTVAARTALSDAGGNFTVSGLPAGTQIVRATRVGYGVATDTVSVVAGQTVTVELEMRAVAVALAELVVTGYGEQRAGDITGAVTQVGSESFNTGRVVSPAKLIQSKVAGVQVVDNNEPGGGLSIRVRGTTSINASSEPLYVIDGVPLGTSSGGGVSAGRDPLNFLNSNDIESITVLRDASSAAIYGANGAAGVVLITTKRGRSDGPHIEYTASVSTSSVTRLPDMLSADQFRTAVTENAPQYVDQLGSANTDWFDLVTRTGWGQSHDLAVSGAGENNSWRMSLGYLKEEGVVQRSTVERVSLGANFSQHLFNDRLGLQFNVRGSRNNDEFTPGGYGIGGVISNAAQFGPTQPVYDDASTTGFYNWPGNSLTSADNPVEILNLATSHGTTYRSVGNLSAEWQLPVLGDAFTAHANVGYDVTQVENATFGPSTLHAEQKTGYDGEFAHNNNHQASTVLETYLTYSAPTSMLPGVLEVTGGYSFVKSNSDFSSLYLRGVGTDLLGTNGTPAATTVTPSSGVNESRLISFFGRVTYNINDRYLLAGSLRRDGSSRFGPDNAWGVFPSVAVAWRLSQEPFLRDVGGLSDLKLRASWAKTGNQSFGDYLQYAAYTYANPQAQVQFGDRWVTPIRPSAVDPNIKWESTRSTDIGLDWGLSNQRFSGTIDWYDKKTTDMIFTVPVAGAVNNSNFVTTNIGSMRNRGIEASLLAQVLDGGQEGLRWSASFTASRNSNEVLSINPALGADAQILTGGISGGVGNTVQVLTPGQPVNAFFLCTQAYQDGAPVDGSYIDSTGAVSTASACYRTPRQGPQPDWNLGHSSYFTYGDFDVSFTLRAYLGNHVYNNVASQMGDYRELYAGTSPYNLHASVLETGFSEARYLSDYYLEDASFLRMDNITLGYSFNIRNVGYRAHFTVQNAFTLTGYTGVDPTAGLNGIDNNIYPRARTFTGGVTVRF
jgi:iron complex outermembrane receptor protein